MDGGFLNLDDFPILHEGPMLVMIDGEFISFHAEPHIINDTMMAPMFEALSLFGADISWDQETGTTTATSYDLTLLLTVGSETAVRNGRDVLLDAAPIHIDGIIFAPIGFIAEAFRFDVKWDAFGLTMFITTPDFIQAETPEIQIISRISGAVFAENHPGFYIGHVELSNIQFVTFHFMDELEELGFIFDEDASEERNLTTLKGNGRTIVLQPGAPYVVMIIE